MGVLKTVEKAVEGAGKGRKKRRKQLKKAQRLVTNRKKAAEKAPEQEAPKPEAPKPEDPKPEDLKPEDLKPEDPELTTEQEKLIDSTIDSINRELHIDDENPSGTSAAGGNTRSKKTGGGTTRTDDHPTGGAGDSTRTTSTDTKTTEERQTVQPGDEEPSGAPKSGGKYNPAEFMEKSKDKNLGRSERRMLERLGKMRANAQKVFEKGTDKQIKNELGRWGIETKEGARATADEYMEKIDEVLRKKAESGPTLGDKFRSHHGVGLTGLGVVGVSTLDLANSRGQQSNAQLYSDPFA